MKLFKTGLAEFDHVGENPLDEQAALDALIARWLELVKGALGSAEIEKPSDSES